MSMAMSVAVVALVMMKSASATCTNDVATAVETNCPFMWSMSAVTVAHLAELCDGTGACKTSYASRVSGCGSANMCDSCLRNVLTAYPICGLSDLFDPWHPEWNAKVCDVGSCKTALDGIMAHCNSSGRRLVKSSPVKDIQNITKQFARMQKMVIASMHKGRRLTRSVSARHLQSSAEIAGMVIEARAEVRAMQSLCAACPRAFLNVPTTCLANNNGDWEPDWTKLCTSGCKSYYSSTNSACPLSPSVSHFPGMSLTNYNAVKVNLTKVTACRSGTANGSIMGAAVSYSLLIVISAFVMMS